MKSAEEYILTDQNKKFNIALPYKGAIKEGSMTWPRKNFSYFYFLKLSEVFF